MVDHSKIHLISQVFTPSAPVNHKELFAGRIEQITDVIGAVGERGQHAILYGERGVGKTSLVTILPLLLNHNNLIMPNGTINCEPTMTFTTLWRTIFEQIVLETKSIPPGFNSVAKSDYVSLAEYLPQNPDHELKPNDVVSLLRQLGKTLIIIDEIDRLQDSQVTMLLSDTIKNLSDHSIDTTLILVGVADSVDALIHEHQSIERALVQIQMPRMSEEELNEIVTKGVQKVNLTIDEDAKHRIIALSQGLPHYTHLLLKHSAVATIQNNETTINNGYLKSAIDKALEKAQQSIIRSYHTATNSPHKGSLYPQVLLACALAKPDSMGYFAASDIKNPMSKIMNKMYNIPAYSQHLNAFCNVGHGPILQKIGVKRKFRFRFLNPLMQPFIIMKGLKENLITEEDIS